MRQRNKARALGDETMTMKTMVCCLMLGSAAMQVPSKAKAATDDDKKFLAMAAQSDQNEIALSQAAS